MSSNSFTIPYLDSLLPRLRVRAELIFAAYPNLGNNDLSRYAILEQLSVKLRRVIELERSINNFIVNNWQQITVEKYRGGAWAPLFHLELKPEANFDIALAEIKKRLQGTNAGAWFSGNKPGEIILSGSRRETLNQIGICGPWLDETSWPLTIAQLCGLKAVAEGSVEYMLGGNRNALDLILNSNV